MNAIYIHRAGRFRIPLEFAQREGLGLLPVFAQVVVLDCRVDHARLTLEYQALSPLFEEIPMGAAAPFYDLVVDTDKGRICGVKFFRNPEAP